MCAHETRNEISGESLRSVTAFEEYWESSSHEAPKSTAAKVWGPSSDWTASGSGDDGQVACGGSHGAARGRHLLFSPSP